MANRIDKLPVDTIISYQQILDFTSQQMHGLFSKIEEDLKNGKVTIAFRNEMEKIFYERITRNNEMSAAIDTEVFKRIRRDLGEGLTNMRDLPKYANMLEEEIAKIEKEKESRVKKKGKLLSLSLKKEKTNDNSKE